MEWPEPPRQPDASMDCEFYALAYIGRLLGYEMVPDDARMWRATSGKGAETFLDYGLGIEPVYRWWSNPLSFYQPAYGNMPAFELWCRAMTLHGCVGYAIFQTHRYYAHAVALLEADETGVLFADSVRGLTRWSWQEFRRPLSDGLFTRIEAWYRLPEPRAEVSE